jgi:hydroxyisourate hydrolase
MPDGYVSLHVLDGYHGCPGADIGIGLRRSEKGEWTEVKHVRTDPDGRTEEPLLAPHEYTVGSYQVVVEVGEYFRKRGVPTTDPPYLERIVLELNFAEPDDHYHVPVTVSPWGYTHFRGS